MPAKSPFILGIALSLAVAAAALAQDTPMAVVDPAIAAMSNDQLVEARQQAMKENGRSLRGAASLSGDQAVAAATVLLQNFTNFPALFREGSITASSKAAPAIWANWEDFKTRLDHDAEAAARMLAAAQSGDTPAYVAAIEEIEASCGSCHMSYRNR